MWGILFAAVLSVASISSWAQSEDILHITPAGYSIDYLARQGNMVLIEQVPVGETVTSWSEMVTTQIFYGNKVMTPRRFHGLMQEPAAASCPGAEVSSLLESEEGGYAVGFFARHCSLNPSTGKPEKTWFKVLRGREHFYVVQKAFKFDPTADQIAKWQEYLRSVRICDTGKDRRACTVVERVTLSGGKIHEVEIARAWPVRFANDQIEVLDLVATLTAKDADVDAVRWVWHLKAKLLEPVRYVVTVTTPLDNAAAATLEVDGPGEISPEFFPRSQHPVIWEGIDQPGPRWFPFQFVFEDTRSKKRFEFTQWTRVDGRVWKERRDMLEKGRQRLSRDIGPKPASVAADAEKDKDWQLISDTPVARAYVHSSSIQRSGSVTRAWMLQDLKREANFGRGAQRSRLVLMEYECHAQSSRLAHASTYSGQMGYGKIVSSDGGEEMWEPVPPNSVGSTFMRKVCSS